MFTPHMAFAAINIILDEAFTSPYRIPVAKQPMFEQIHVTPALTLMCDWPYVYISCGHLFVYASAAAGPEPYNQHKAQLRLRP